MVADWKESTIGLGWQREIGTTRGGTPVVRRSSDRRAVVASYGRSQDESGRDSFMAGQARGSRSHPLAGSRCSGHNSAAAHGSRRSARRARGSPPGLTLAARAPQLLSMEPVCQLE